MRLSPDRPQFLSPPAVAKLLGVSAEKIVKMIRKGELRAIDVSEHPGIGKPRFRVGVDALRDFLKARAVVPEPTPQKRRRKDPNVIQFY